MKTMTDYRSDGRQQATKEASNRIIDRAAVNRGTRFDTAGMQENMAMPEDAQSGAQCAKRRRNRSIGRRAVLLFKINERLMKLSTDRLQLVMLYVCMQKVAQAIQKVKMFEPKKAANARK